MTLYLSGQSHHQTCAVVTLQRGGERPDEKLVRFWLQDCGGNVGHSGAGAKGGVLERSGDTRVASGRQRRHRVNTLLGHVAPTGGDGGGSVVLHVALVGLHGVSAGVKGSRARSGVPAGGGVPGHAALLQELVQETHLGGGSLAQH